MNTKEDVQHRLELVTKKHKHQHEIVSALEAEKAPEKAIKSAKVLKLKLKDEMEYLGRLNFED
tara:strand:- start:183 stop:371 length:189 start_codon:yes stop_codon:yes gene_type:complete